MHCCMTLRSMYVCRLLVSTVVREIVTSHDKQAMVHAQCSAVYQL
jgi:hypothetical protein